jgi:cytochrome P450
VLTARPCPLPSSCRALRARDELVGYFQAGITEARQQLAAGQQPGGVLGRLVGAEDEEGNRYVREMLSLSVAHVVLVVFSRLSHFSVV